MEQSYTEALRARGYRMTPQREMIIETILQAKRHMTAEEIMTELRKRTQVINIATVYRTLELLVEEGLACQNDLGGGCVYYSTIQHGPHIHLVCRHCHQVIDADYPLIAPLELQLREVYGFAADLRHLSITGVCAACQPVSVPKEV